MSFIRPLLLSSFALAAFSPLYATQSDNHGIHAVPPPGPVVIDGKLGDWDLSGSVLMCYDLETLRDVYSVEASIMYDATACYIALRWKDPVPLGNSHDPHFQASKGWAGDALQLRLKTDRISHVTAWYFAAKQQSFMHLDYGKSLTEPFGGGERKLFPVDGWKLDGGAEQAFVADADGRGYVQEIKLPWALITTAGQQPKEFACGFELLWGEADWPVHRYSDNLAVGHSSREFFWTAHQGWGPVVFEKSGNLKLPKPAFLAAMEEVDAGGVVPVPYTAPKAGRVTLAIDDAQGRRVRNLTAAQARAVGANTEKWDGLDDAGKPVPPGEYRLRGLVHDGIRANWLMSFSSPGNPPWSTPDGKGAFYGDHTAPQAAASAGDYVALACPMGEGGQHLIACDLTGQRLWGLANRTAFDGGHISLATDGKILWVANDAKQSTIYRVDIATGRYAPWSLTKTDADGRTAPVLDHLVTEAPGFTSGKNLGVNLRSIAVRNGKLAVCLMREGKVLVLNGDSTAVERTIAIDAPRSVTWLPDGALAVLSGASVKKIAADDAVTALGDAAWQDAAYLTSDASGQLYLSMRAERQQVQVLSSSGAPVRTIGVAGGRPNHGTYIAGGMRLPAQPAVDRSGRLWVPEETINPKRTSIWNTADGALVKELVGTTSYAGAGSINPDDATMGFSEQTVFRLDLKNGTSQPIFSIGGGGGGHGHDGDADDLFPPRIHELTNRTITIDGRIYVFTTDSARGADEVHCTMFDGKNWRSVAHLGTVTNREQEGQDHKYRHPLFAGRAGDHYVWADADGDGRVQAAELTFAKTIGDEALQLASNYWGQLPGPDGAVPYRTKRADRLVRFPIAGFTACGAPRYDFAKVEVIKLDQAISGGGNGEGMVMGGANGLIHVNQDPLITVDASGKVLGTYPNPFCSVHGSHNALAAKPGYLIGPSSILGTADLGGDLGGIWYLNGNLGENYIFTSDGLWVQGLFKDCRGGFDTPTQAVRGMSVDAMSAGGESFGGNFVRTSDGRFLLTACGTDARVIELTGLTSLKRFSGAFTYTADQWRSAQQALEERAAKTNQPKRWSVPRAGDNLAIDGKASEWPEFTDDKAPALLIGDDVKRPTARVALRWSATHLHIAWRVRDDHDMLRNVGQDERLLFKTGDAVDLMLVGGDPAGQRLLVTTFGGQPAAMLYEKHVAGTAESARVPFSSPWRTIHFDRVSRPSDVTAAFGKISGGWFAEAHVPWSRLGIKPSAGQELRGDVGVLKADRGGTTTVGRHYWSNRATGLVNDIPGEAELTPKLWGTLVLE